MNGPFDYVIILLRSVSSYETPTAPPSKGVSLTIEHRTGFGSGFSNEFHRSDFVIADNDSGCKIDGEELMKVVVNKLEEEILGHSAPQIERTRQEAEQEMRKASGLPINTTPRHLPCPSTRSFSSNTT